jgi:hypothetical protein
MNLFDTVEVLAEFSGAIYRALIALESLRDVAGMDPTRVDALTESVRRVHSQTTVYLVSVIGRPELVAAGGIQERRSL